MYYSLQIGRGIAALTIVLLHYSFIFASQKYFNTLFYRDIFTFGNAGVQFFFVLSGFIIYTIHQKDISQPHKAIKYIKKRLIRIYPVFWIIFLGVFIAIYFTPLRATLPMDINIIIKSLLLLPQDASSIVGGHSSPVITVAWSLKYEMFFYLLFLFAIINIRLFIVAIISYILLLLFYQNQDILYVSLHDKHNTNIILFFFGICVAILNKSNFNEKSITNLLIIGGGYGSHSYIR